MMLAHLEAGRIVILDLSVGNPDLSATQPDPQDMSTSR